MTRFFLIAFSAALLLAACTSPSSTPTPIPPIAAKNILVNWEPGEIEDKPSKFFGFDGSSSGFLSLKRTRITFVDKTGDVALIPDYGSIWMTENGGISWQKVSNLLCQTPIAKDPGNPDVMYVGTRNDATVYKSTDGGNTWEALPVIGLSRTSEDIFQGVMELVIDAKGRIWIMLNSGVFKSEDGGEHWSRIGGTYPFSWKYDVAMSAEGKSELRIYEGADTGQIWNDLGEADLESSGDGRRGRGPFRIGLIVGDHRSEIVYGIWYPVRVYRVGNTYGGTNTATMGMYLLKTADGGTSWEGTRDDALRLQLGDQYANSYASQEFSSDLPSFRIRDSASNRLIQRFDAFWSPAIRTIFEVRNIAIDPNGDSNLFALASLVVVPAEELYMSPEKSKELARIRNNLNSGDWNCCPSDPPGYYWGTFYLTIDGGESWIELNAPEMGNIADISNSIAVISSGDRIKLYFMSSDTVWHTSLSLSDLMK